ncbi:MAG: GNAT family N-acetyltransferase [Phototrophicaceae bacterium]
MPEVSFRKIDANNYKEALKLKVSEAQIGFVAPNERSLLQSAYEAPDSSTPYGVYDGETMIGFLLTSHSDDDPDTLWVWRFMIGEDYQGKGYGKSAMKKLIADTQAEGKFTAIRLSYMPDNIVGQHVYASVGFTEEGIKEDWGEMVAVCDLSQS